MNHRGHHREPAPAGRARMPADRAGFTLIEILVVIVIILALLGILVAAVGRIAGYASSTAANATLSTLSTAISAYYNDAKAIPPSTAVGTVGGVAVTAVWNGGELLAQCLSSPRSDDGLGGYGFKVGSGTTAITYGPYVPPKHSSNIVATVANARYKYTLPDSPGQKAVLYYRFVNGGHVTPAITSASAGIFSTAGRFNTAHNDTLDGADQPNLYWRDPINTAGKASTSERDSFAYSLRSAKYLMVLPGPDDKFGTADDVYMPGSTE